LSKRLTAEQVRIIHSFKTKPIDPRINITIVFKNKPKNKDIEKNVMIFLIGKTVLNNAVNPRPNNIAIGTNIKNLKDTKIFPIKYNETPRREISNKVAIFILFLINRSFISLKFYNKKTYCTTFKITP
jgi:hypothetical protein